MALSAGKVQRAQQLERGGDWAGAEQAYAQLLLSHARHPALLWGRGRCLMNLQRSYDAAQCLVEAIAHYGGNAHLLQDASSRLIILGRPAEALEATAKGIQRFTGNHQLLLNHADALRLLGRHPEAIAALKKLRKLAPDHAGVVTSLSFCLRHNGQAEEALALLEKVGPSMGGSGLSEAALRNELAHCQQQLGQHPGAVAPGGAGAEQK